MDTFQFDAPFGPIAVSCASAAVTGIRFLPADTHGAPQTAFAEHVAEELTRYFADPTFVFSVPVQLAGTPFQLRLWHALRQIPAGEVRRYGELSAALASSARAVGGACRHNPVPVIVPCHRVVSASGDGGFAGATDGPLLAIKRWLLRHEGARVDRVDGIGRTADLFGYVEAPR